jgi:hypothetical protein
MIHKRQLLETTSQLGLARVEALCTTVGATAAPPFEIFAESFRGLSAACGGVRMAWRVHADDEEFEEA